MANTNKTTKQESFRMRAHGVAGGLTITTASRNQTPPTEQERRAAFLRGCVRLGGDPAKVAKLRSLDAEIAILDEQLASPKVDHAAGAAAAAGKKLWAVLGRACFESEAEASAWSRRALPMTAAAKSAKDAELEERRADRQRHDTRQAFWTGAAELAKVLAHFTSATADPDRMVDEVSQAGVR